MAKKKIRVAINGFGRIGRAAFKIILEDKKYEIVGINDLASAESLAYLLKYDTVYGKYYKKVNSKDHNIIINNKKYNIISESQPAKLPWNVKTVLLVEFAAPVVGGSIVVEPAEVVKVKSASVDQGIPGPAAQSTEIEKEL